MNTQLQIEFKTESPINTRRLSGQNQRLYDFLMAGNKINCMSLDRFKLRIGVMNSRISDLRNKFKIPVEGKFIKVIDDLGEEVSVCEYWIAEENRINNKIAA